MKKHLLLSLILIALAFSLASETIYQQDFENETSDNWNYSAVPEPNRIIWWGTTDQPIGGATAPSGDWYWASWDLDNQNHALIFDNIDLPAGYLYQIKFYYFTKNLNPATDYCRYTLSFDNGVSWQEPVVLEPNTESWNQVTIEVPHYATNVMLKMEALYDGINKYVHWDSFALHKLDAPPAAPTVYNVQTAQRRDGSGMIDISYQLFDLNNDNSSISLFVSFDGGETFDYQPSLENLSGDIGANIPSGTFGQIAWDTSTELIDFENDQCAILIKAEDGTVYPTLPTPIFNPPAGLYDEIQMVSISCTEAGAEIRYTLDGSEPDANSLLYTEPIEIATNTTLKAKADKAYWLSSETGVAVYQIQSERFVFVDGGTFNNGTSDVTLSNFYIDKYQLTQADYIEVMGAWDSDPYNHEQTYGIGDNYPVYYVSWYNAIEYCNRRSMQEGLTPCYIYNEYGTNPSNWPDGWNSTSTNHPNIHCNWTANGYRLPTEMEWMFAAKGGNQSQGYTYSGSNDINAVAWYGSNSGNTTHTVGTKLPNELGIYDMSGNVYEWCWDIYGYYPIGAQTNPHGDTSGSGRVVRGGSWNYDAGDCTVSYRSFSLASHSFDFLGFRVCRVLDAPLSVLPTPVFDPPAGIYEEAQMVSITCAEADAEIRYTLDGTEPDEYSMLYTEPIEIAGSTTIKAKAYKEYWFASETAVAVYQIQSERFVFVDGGTFNNGTSDVTLSSFYIDKYETTQAEFQAVMGAWDSDPFGWGSAGIGDNHPVYYASWYNAIEYCNRRSMLEGFAPCYSYNGYGINPEDWPSGWNTSDYNHTNVICNWAANGYRLPTEMEWMFAAKGGNQSQGYTYSGSNNIDEVAWYYDNSYNMGSSHPDYGTHTVGTKLPNELGIYDMSGNVLEWCWDIYGSYPSGAQTNPHGATSGSDRVRRGGHWYNSASDCTVSRRNAYDATSSSSGVGFRVCRVLEPPLSMLPTPVFDPPAGIYEEVQMVSITCAEAGAEIRYTLDGSEPDEYSTLYTEPIQIAGNITIKAKAYKENWLASETAVAVYQIQSERFVFVEGGTFNNGTSNVTLSNFYIDKYQLTQADYEAVMGAWDSDPYNYEQTCGIGDNYPVYWVTWYNAIEYCNRRSMLEGFTPCYNYGSYGTNPANWPSGWNTNYGNHTNVSCNWTANGYRLPTEMEWMFAAKGGNQSQGYTYSGSNNIDEVAWYDSNSGSTTHTVGTKLPNELGIYDMSGNVWEWCWDIYGSYPSGAQSNPHGATSGSGRVFRGGSWYYYAGHCTVSYRDYEVATISGSDLGFRVCRVSP